MGTPPELFPRHDPEQDDLFGGETAGCDRYDDLDATVAEAGGGESRAGVIVFAGDGLAGVQAPHRRPAEIASSAGMYVTVTGHTANITVLGFAKSVSLYYRAYRDYWE